MLIDSGQRPEASATFVCTLAGNRLHTADTASQPSCLAEDSNVHQDIGPYLRIPAQPVQLNMFAYEHSGTLP